MQSVALSGRIRGAAEFGWLASRGLRLATKMIENPWLRILKGVNDLLEQWQQSRQSVSSCVDDDNRKRAAGEPLLVLHVLISGNEGIAVLVEKIEQCSVFEASRIYLLHGGNVMLEQMSTKGPRHVLI